jgi:hypothetical protein
MSNPELTETKAKTSRRNWKPPRWLQVIALLVSGTGITVLVIRARRVARLREVVERQQEEGLPFGFDDLVHLSRRANPRVQASYAESVGRLRSLPSYDRTLDRPKPQVDAALASWITGSASAPPTGLREDVEEARPAVQEITALAGDGGLLASTLGWFPRKHPGVSLLAASKAIEDSSLFPVAVLRWHRYAALLGEDPEKHLADMDALLSAQDPPGSLVDSFLGHWSRYERDRVHLELALARRLPRDRESAFLARGPDDLIWAADGVRGERLLFESLLAEDILAGRHRLGNYWRKDLSSSEQAMVPFVWFCGPLEAATSLKAHAGAERALRFKPNGVPVKDLKALVARDMPRFSVVPCLVEEPLRFAVLCDARGRAVRAAVALLGDVRKLGRIPADEAEARSWLGRNAQLLDPGERRVRLRYERPADNVIRIGVDPSTAPPLLVDDWGESPPAWLLGKPPSNASLLVGLSGVEFRLRR